MGLHRRRKPGRRFFGAVDIVEREEARPHRPPVPPHPGTGDRRHDVTFPADELQQSHHDADPWASERTIEGDAEKEAGERGLSLTDLTVRETPVPGKMSINRDWSESYSSENQYEDADLKLGRLGEDEILVEGGAVVAGHRAVVDQDFHLSDGVLDRRMADSGLDVRERTSGFVEQEVDNGVKRGQGGRSRHGSMLLRPSRYVKKKKAIMSDRETLQVLQLALRMAPYQVDVYNPQDVHMILNDFYDAMQRAESPAYDPDEVRELIQAVMNSTPERWAQQVEYLLGARERRQAAGPTQGDWAIYKRHDGKYRAQRSAAPPGFLDDFDTLEEAIQAAADAGATPDQIWYHEGDLDWRQGPRAEEECPICRVFPGHARRHQIKQAQEIEGRQPWVAVDLDGTILEDPTEEDYVAMEELVRETGEAQQPILKDPMPGAAEALNELASLGWRVSIWTARFGDDLSPADKVRFRDEIERHLELSDIPFSDIWIGEKPRADYYIDNKAVPFDGDWGSVLSRITALDPDGAQGYEEAVEVHDHDDEEEKDGVALIDPIDDPFEGGFLDADETREDRSIPRAPATETMVYGS